MVFEKINYRLYPAKILGFAYEKFFGCCFSHASLLLARLVSYGRRQ
jgi:hypothetical protein